MVAPKEAESADLMDAASAVQRVVRLVDLSGLLVERLVDRSAGPSADLMVGQTAVRSGSLVAKSAGNLDALMVGQMASLMAATKDAPKAGQLDAAMAVLKDALSVVPRVA